MATVSEAAKEMTIAYISKMTIPPPTGGPTGDFKKQSKEDAERIVSVYTIIYNAIKDLS